MRKLSAIFVYLTLALWLPATQHCALELVGIFANTCSDHDATGQSSDKDGCGTVENGAYKPAGDMLKVPAPSILLCLSFLCLHLPLPEAQDEQLILPAESFQQSERRVATWHFVRRAAPLPGAPSLILA